MKNRAFTLLPLLLLFLVSCHERIDTMSTASESADVEAMRVADFPGKLPLGAYPFELSMKGITDWRDYAIYYRTDLPQEAGKHYYDNLRAATLYLMIEQTDLLDAAPLTDRQYYLNEIFASTHINNPRAALELIKNVATEDETIDMPAYARRIVEVNKAHLSESALTQHQERFKETYQELYRLGWNRWGEVL